MKPVLTLDLRTATYSIEHVAPRVFVLLMIHKSSIPQPEVALGAFKTQASAKKYAEKLDSRRTIHRLEVALKALEQK